MEHQIQKLFRIILKFLDWTEWTRAIRAWINSYCDPNREPIIGRDCLEVYIKTAKI